jgi:hypothetical protein
MVLDDSESRCEDDEVELAGDDDGLGLARRM